jgi:hypothetical protein
MKNLILISAIVSLLLSCDNVSHQIGGLVHRYSGLAAEIEKYIRQQPPFQKQ